MNIRTLTVNQKGFEQYFSSFRVPTFPVVVDGRSIVGECESSRRWRRLVNLWLRILLYGLWMRFKCFGACWNYNAGCNRALFLRTPQGNEP